MIINWPIDPMKFLNLYTKYHTTNPSVMLIFMFVLITNSSPLWNTKETLELHHHQNLSYNNFFVLLRTYFLHCVLFYWNWIFIKTTKTCWKPISSEKTLFCVCILVLFYNYKSYSTTTIIIIHYYRRKYRLA